LPLISHFSLETSNKSDVHALVPILESTHNSDFTILAGSGRLSQ